MVDTLKTTAIPAENERDGALTAYLKAYDAYCEQKTEVNRIAMYQAYEHLQEIKKLYNEGRTLKRDRAVFGAKQS
jgi:hypothetical protein